MSAAVSNAEKQRQQADAARARPNGVPPTAASSSGTGYTPAADDVRTATFKWMRACSVYTLRGVVATHKGGGQLQYRPVIGDLPMLPNTGRYFYEFRVNTDNCRVGVCTSTAYPTDPDLEAYELGKCAASTSPPAAADSGSPTYLQSIGATPTTDKPVVAVVNVQTSQVVVNGVQQKHLWRLFTSSAGAYFSFVVDTDEGIVQMFVDKKYAGMVFDHSAGLKGCTLYPCVGLGGMDMHNRAIGTGMLSATVSPSHRFDGLY